MNKNKKSFKVSWQEKTPIRHWRMSIFIWLGVKNDYRTLIGLEGANVVNISDNIDEDEDEKSIYAFS